MKRLKEIYIFVWAVLVAAFVLVVLFVPDSVGVWKRKGSSFWASAFIMLLMMGAQLACTLRMLKDGNKERMFLRLPVAYVSIASLVLMFAAELACVLLPNGKNWLALAVGVVILAVYAVLAVSFMSAADAIEGVEQRTKDRTAFMRSLLAEAQLLSAQAKTAQGQKLSADVQKALRGSDPCSDERLDEVEARLYTAFSAFADAVRQGDDAACGGNYEAFAQILAERNAKCRILK